MKKLGCLIFLSFLLAHAGWSQQSNSSLNSSSTFASSNQQSNPGAQPDIPGNLVVDFGSNFFQNAPDTMDLKVWGSRGINIFYQHNISFAGGHFSFNPGLGLAWEKFSFKNNITVTKTPDQDTLQISPVTGFDELKKSQLGANYVDLPLELRFYTNSDNRNRGLMVGIGGKISYLLGSYTKLKYEEGGNTIKQKTKRPYQLNPLRYGLQARIGFQGINLFGYYGLSPVFKSERGPMATEATNFKLGLSVSLF